MKCWTRSCFTDEETQEENFGWNQLSCGPVLALISCTKLGIQLSTCSSPIVPKYISFLICASNLEFWTSLCFTDQETQEESFGCNQLPCGPVLIPISCTKSKIHSLHKRSPIIPKQVLCWQFGMSRPVNASHIKKLRKRFLGGTSSLVGRFLHPSPVQSPRSIQHMNTVQLFLNKSCTGNLECGTSLCFTDQETREEISGCD